MRSLSRRQHRWGRRHLGRSYTGSGLSRYSSYQRAMRRGLYFATFALASRHFLGSQDSSKFPVTFANKPSKRPYYIPKTTSLDGRQYPVVWSPKTGGYVIEKDGQVIAYGPMKDFATQRLMMSRSGYFWGAVPSQSHGRRSSSGWLSKLITLAVLIIMIASMVVVFTRLKRKFSGQSGSRHRRGRVAVGPPSGPRQHEPDHPHFWLQVEVGDMISVNDMQSWTDMLKAANASTFGQDFVVRSALRMRAIDDHWQSALFGIDQLSAMPGDQSLWMLVWRQAGQVELSVYYTPKGIQLGTRADMLDRGDNWLFEPPSGDDWMPNDLQFVHQVTHSGTNESGTEVEQVFKQSAAPAAFGLATAYPGNRSVRSLRLVRWRCPEAMHNPLMLLVEFGAMERMEGGHLQLLLGTSVRPDELDVPPLGADRAA